MPRTAVITDTDASLPVEITTRFGIRQVPINIHFGEETLATGIEIDDTRLFARVDREGRLPTTSAPSPGQFAEAYDAAFEEGATQIVCFCVSSEVSATYNAAVVARDLYPGRDITVVDTRSLTMGQGFMVLAAAEAAAAGSPVDEVVARALSVGQRVHIYAALSTVKYMAMSGRIGNLAAGMATLLNVKPILAVGDGKLDLLERVRTQKKAWTRVMDLTAEALGGQPIEQMAIVHASALEDARQFEGLVRDQLSCPSEVFMAELSPGLSVHSGAGLVGLVAVAGGSP